MKSTTRMVALCALASAMLAGPALADTSKMRIAFSNNYAGNSWRQAMLNSYDIVTKKAVADKIVAAADVFTTADKEVPTQAAQIQNLILQGYNAIVINAGSPDALNGAVKQACDAGIVVVSFDGIVTEPCAWRVVVDFKDMGKQEVAEMAKFQPKGGNLLEIRGLAGTSIDDAIHAGILEGVKEHPDFKIVSSVTGDGTRRRRRRRWRRCCPRCRRSSASSIRAATATAPPRRSPRRASRVPPSSWAIVRTNWNTGRNRRRRMDIRLGRPRSRPASPLSHSGSRSRCSTAGKTFLTICWCLTSPSRRADFEAELPKIAKGGVASHEYTQADAIAAIKANMK